VFEGGTTVGSAVVWTLATPRRLLALMLGASLVAPDVVSQVGAPDPELVAGIRQVKEGDFETAVLTLDGVSRRLSGDPARRRDLAQANLYLGIAYLGLDQRPPAKERFRKAVEADEDLRLSPDRFSPKVLALFDEARREVEAQRKAAAKGGAGSKGLYIALGVGGAAAAVALVAKGGSNGTPPAGSVAFSNARFGTPVIDCPNGFKHQPIAFTILVDADNSSSAPVSVTSVSVTAIIAISAIPSEIGQASSRPSTAAPDAIGAGARATLTISSTLDCDNDPGNAPRFNEWTGRATLTTSSSGARVLEVADRLRVNVP
jgi:hypothetical protein